jgi:hypothetical protein
MLHAASQSVRGAASIVRLEEYAAAYACCDEPLHAANTGQPMRRGCAKRLRLVVVVIDVVSGDVV